jgi:hypothetical protein
MTAFLVHHWYERTLRFPRVRLWRSWVRLQLQRLVNLPQTLRRDGVPASELDYWVGPHFYRSYLSQRRQPRRYHAGVRSDRGAACTSTGPNGPPSALSASDGRGDAATLGTLTAR